LPSEVVTLSDIALLAGVSPSTVSRALSGAKPVAPATQARVARAVRELDYRPNPVARALARGRTMSIGVLTLDYRLFFGRMLEGVEQALDGSGYRPLVASMRSRSLDVAEELRMAELLVGQRVDAVIVLGGRLAKPELHHVVAGLPVVAVMPEVIPTTGYVLDIDTRAAACSATRYLIGLGHQRIAHIGGIPGHPHAQARLLGYQQALAEAGLPLRPDLVVAGQFDEPSGRTAVETLLTRGEPFTALFVGNDQMAFGAMLSLHLHGLRVPDDISVVGFDDVRLSAFTTPPLTTVHFPAHELGQAAARVALDLLAGREPRQIERTLELVIRQSARARVRSSRRGELSQP
jgi:LacI family transcriptional regulator